MNREHWLTKVVEELKAAFFAPDKMEFSSPIKISTGWCRGSKKAIGQCWSNKCSAGDFVEIFIAPNIHEPVQVLATVLHELIHAHLGNHKGHGKDFKAIVKKFGLSGRVTATFAAEGSDLFGKLQKIAEALGNIRTSNWCQAMHQQRRKVNPKADGFASRASMQTTIAAWSLRRACKSTAFRKTRGAMNLYL